MVQPKGVFTISLDFELMWGVRDHRTIDSYGANIIKVHEIVPELLRLFKQYGIHCTWSTVGLLFGKSLKDVLGFVPPILPEYRNAQLNPYPFLENEKPDSPYWFAPDLIELIAATEGQEISTHTFSHYYTLEDGANPESFRSDIQAAQSIAKRDGLTLSTIVFPRNQYNEQYLAVCAELGIRGYRGTEKHWIYQSRSRKDEKGIRRMIRLADSYVNLSGNHTSLLPAQKEQLINIPASRFLRPYSPKLRLLEKLRLRRITSSMECAAAKGEVYHLWWHPHNFGSYTEENFFFLEQVLQAYQRLGKSGRMESLTMLEICNRNTHHD